MPLHLFSEWINEIPTVPIYNLAKRQPREHIVSEETFFNIYKIQTISHQYQRLYSTPP